MPKEIICPNLMYLKNVYKLLTNEWNTKEWRGCWYYIVFKSLAMFNNNSKKFMMILREHLIQEFEYIDLQRFGRILIV